MALRLYDVERADVLLERAIPEVSNRSDVPVNEWVTYLEYPIGKGYYKEFFFDGIHIGFGNASLQRKALLGFESDIETVEMHFALKGKSAVKAETFDQTICFETHQHNIIYANGISGKMQWEADELRLCEINLAPTFFKKILSPDVGLFDRFRNAMEKGKSDMMMTANYRISHAMHDIIEGIIACQRQGVFKRMFLEAKVIELLLLQLEQFADSRLGMASLKKNEIDKLYEVREFISTNLDSTYSLIDLAHHVGTNEFTLKKGFKELFGTTVFGFWHDVKMEQAKRLLLDHGMNVGEVSDAVGYRNQRHFCSAFKRKYGIVPSTLKG